MVFNYKSQIIIYIIILNFFLLITKSYADCNFKSYKFINELNDPSKIEEIKIDVINKKKYNINYLRIVDYEKFNIPNKFKKYFKSKITIKYPFGQCIFKGSVRQTGDIKGHVGLIKRSHWLVKGKNPILFRSLLVKLSEGNIFNSVRFKLYIPESRNNLNEVLGSLILREIGFISPETFQVNTNINGKKNIMIFQEDIRKELLERNNRREGPIFEGEDSMNWLDYDFETNTNVFLSRLINKNFFLKGKNQSLVTLDAYKILQQSYLEYSVNNHDVDKATYMLHLNTANLNNDEIFKNYHLALLTMNGSHGLSPNNRQFYFNIFTRAFEPIYYDGDLILDKNLFINNESALPKDKKLIIDKELLFFIMNGNKKFVYSKLFSNIENKNNLLNKFKKRVVNFDQASSNFFKKTISSLIENEEKIHKFLTNSLTNSKVNKLKNIDLIKGHQDYLNKLKKYNDLNKSDLKILNQTTLVEFHNNDNQFLAKSSNNKILKLSMEDVSEIISRNSLNNSRYVYLPIMNLSKKVNYINYSNLNFDAGEILHSNTLNVDIDEKSKNINLIQSNPNDWALLMNANLKDWTVNFNGLIPPNQNKDLKFERINEIGLTGCLNFFNIKFNKTSINSNNGMCEDNINIINSAGELKLVKVNNAYSDALDIDFSKISLEELYVNKALNDCSDFSGGFYKIKFSNLDYCGDKAISIGEKSNFQIDKLIVKNSNIGIASKDSSISLVKDSIFQNLHTCITAYNKKQEFHGSLLEVKNLTCKNYSIKQYTDINSNIKINNFLSN